MKLSVVVFTGFYLPGYKSGGILRNVVNTVDNLACHCDFRIITKDRDLGDPRAYEGVPASKWTRVGKALVYYLPEGGGTIKNLYYILKETPCDVIYLTSFFDPLTVKVLVIRFFIRKMFGRVIVAPFGEFAWASFGQKAVKKILFVAFARFVGLYRGVFWRVSSNYEAKELLKVMSPPFESIMITGDLPVCAEPASQENTIEENESGYAPVDFRLVFLSRISAEKNLDLALNILMKVKSRVSFDIYGPIENRTYWFKCQKIISNLPNNIVVKYLGVVSPEVILKTFSAYDLFLFPTGGEAYGNVIAESLSAGTPVLISQNTPWRNLKDDGLGWDIDLSETDKFVKIIEEEALRDARYRKHQRNLIRKAVREKLFDPKVLDSNLRLFGIDASCKID